MKIRQCNFCNKLKYTPVQITEVQDDGSVEVKYSCQACHEKWGKNKTAGPLEPQTQVTDLKHINTPDELLAFLAGHMPKTPGKQPCECGMTEIEFDKYGRFGCPKCYAHFSEKMEELVFPFHKSKEHAGKKPRRSIREAMMNDPVEKEKYLKLKYAKALELEEYEKCAEIKKELDALKNSQQP